MTTVLLGSFSLAALSVLIWLFLADPMERARRGSQVLWLIVMFFPALYTLVRGRPAYNQPPEVWASPLSAVLTPIQGFGALVAAVVCWTCFPLVRHSHRPVVLAIILYGLAQATSDLFNASYAAAIGPLISLLVVMAIFLREEGLAVLKTRVTRMLRVYTWGSLIIYCVAPAWSVVPAIHSSRKFFGLESRFVGLSPGPNYIAIIASLAFLVEVFPLYRRRGWLASATCALAICVWSQGRSALLILLVAAIVAIGVRVKSREWLVLTALVASATGLAALLVTSIRVGVARQLSPANIRELTTGRPEAWAVAWKEFLRSPLVGRGSSVFSTDYWSGSSVHGGIDFANAHNQFLQALAQGGILGLSVTIGLLGCLTHLGVRASKATGGFSLAVLGVLIAQVAFGTPLHSSGFSVNLIALALCVGVLATYHPEQESPPTGQVGQNSFRDRQQGSLHLGSHISTTIPAERSLVAERLDDPRTPRRWLRA